MRPVERVRLGDALAALARDAGVADEDAEALERERPPAEPMAFE